MAEILRSAREGPRAAQRGSPKALIAATARAMRDLLGLLPRTRAVVVEERAREIVVHGLAPTIHLSFAARAPSARITALFEPVRIESLRDGTVQYFAQGGGTLRARNDGNRARSALAPWLLRLPPATDVALAYQDFCWEGGEVPDLGVVVVTSPAALTGAFVNRVHVARIEDRWWGNAWLVVEFVAGSGDKLFDLAESIGADNRAAFLLWGDHVLMRSWAAVLNPTPGERLTKSSLRVRAPRQDCFFDFEVVAERIRVAALLEAARMRR